MPLLRWQWCRPVGDEPDIDPALLGAEQRLDDA
jgi:hypothetical protein